MPEANSGNFAPRLAEAVGRGTARGVGALGFGVTLFWESMVWVLVGRRRRQVVRSGPIFAEAMEVGIRALPIVSVLSFTIGLMLAIQGINALEAYGAENNVTLGVSISIVREFGPLITGILVAGRSGSAIAARLATMTINNEVDALQVMGINPVRYLVVPSLLALTIMVPLLALWADFMGMLGAGIYITTDLGMTMTAYVYDTLKYVDVGDVFHGLEKALIFGVLVAMVGVVDGSSVKGGAEGVGRVTTAAVVHGISAIVLTDMIFTFVTTR